MCYPMPLAYVFHGRGKQIGHFDGRKALHFSAGGVGQVLWEHGKGMPTGFR